MKESGCDRYKVPIAAYLLILFLVSWSKPIVFLSIERVANLLPRALDTFFGSGALPVLLFALVSNCSLELVFKGREDAGDKTPFAMVL
jgi:hypothetical protein